MRFMDHGAFRQAATPCDGGRYVLPLSFAMGGEWEIDVDIATSKEKGKVQLDVDIIH